MALKKHYFPLLLLPLSVIFLFSHYHQRDLHHPQNAPNPNLIRTKNPHLNPNFTLIIKVLAFDRLSSLSRCLRSLAAAHYAQDTVHLHIYIDHFNLPNPADRDIISSALDGKLENSRRILNFVDGFFWRYGEKIVHYRTANVGLQAQWLESWWPSSDDEFAFIVEDDLEVAPLYYKFLKNLIQTYYYNASNFSPSIYGASLQRPRFVPGKHGNAMRLDSTTRLFMYQLVGTWGQLLFPRPWKEFRMWYDTHKAKSIKPFLQGMVTTGWYKRMGERIWTPWFIKFIHSRGYFNIYTNFLHERALSVSHRDAGVNYGKAVGPDSSLMDEDPFDFDLLEMQPLSNLKWYDFCFRQITPDRIIRRTDELDSFLFAMQQEKKRKKVIIVNLVRASERVIRNLICHFERLNIRNYIFLGPNTPFLLDLARRGHPVIDACQFFESTRPSIRIDSQESDMELVKEVLVVAFVIKKCAYSGFDSLLVNGNLLFNSSDFSLDFDNPAYDVHAGKRSGFLLTQSSLSARFIWDDDLTREIAASVVSLREGMSRGGFFAYVAVKLLERKGARIKMVDEELAGVSFGSRNTTETSWGDGKKMVFWPCEMDGDLVEKRLEEMGMWVIDGDSSCKAVACHQL